MRRCPNGVNVLAVRKRESRLPSASSDNISKSRSSTLFSLLHSTFFTNVERKEIFYTVGEVMFYEKMAWAREAYEYSKK